MDQVKIIIEGYARAGDNGSFVASSASTLILHKDKKILVDFGTNRGMLLEGLKREKLEPKDIDILYLTHYHPDHFLNMYLFPGKEIHDGTILWQEDKEVFYEGKIPHTDLEIVLTPGHCPEHTSIMVETKDMGIVCVAHDVFWWEDGNQKAETLEDLMELEDPFASDIEALRKSRELVLERADWIVPGHGRMFKNPTKK
jgi:glyoxylase-like metal-dependent hydrolase (beta-lactamase superfamily II)